MVQAIPDIFLRRISTAEGADGDTGHPVCPVFVERLPAAEPDTDRQEGIYPSGSDVAVPGYLFKSDGSASGRPCDVDYSDYYLICRAAEVYYCRCCCRSSKILMNV